MAIISLIWGTFEMMIKSTRASATSSTPHSAKGDWGRERLGAASFLFVSFIFS